LPFKPEPDGTVWIQVISGVSPVREFFSNGANDEIRCFAGEGFLVASRKFVPAQGFLDLFHCSFLLPFCFGDDNSAV